MTKISQLSSIGDSLAVNDQFLIRDVDDATTPNKSVTVSGITRALDVGSATAPAIAFATDKNTGIYSPGADQVAISTNGSGRLFVDASGNVGLGVASPGALLHLAQSAADAVARIDGGSSSTAFIDFRIAGANKSYVGLGGLTGGSNNDLINYNSSAGNWIAYTNGSERLRITSAGLVGIGTSSPNYILETSQPGTGGVVVGASLAASGNGGSGRGTGLLFKAPGSSSAVEVARIDGRQNTASATANDATLNFMVADSGGTLQERLTITNAGRVGIGATSPSETLHVVGTAQASQFKSSGGAGATGYDFSASGSGAGVANIFCPSGFTLGFGTSSLERARIDSSGRLLVGTSSTSATCRALFQGNSSSSSGATPVLITSGASTPGNGDPMGGIEFGDSSHITSAWIYAYRDGGTWSGSSKPTRLVFFTTADGASSPTERMRIGQSGLVTIGTTNADPSGNNVVGCAISPDSYISLTRDNGIVIAANRKTSDGSLMAFRQDGTDEGSISVSGTTVSYNGAHLSRWSQIKGIDPHDKTDRPEILRGTVMSNLDEMCDWIDPESGEAQDNEQLNKTKISDVEGDKNVAGVFQSWDDDDDTWVNDYYLAMTGDFIIRIAEGVAVERGDLLMSAGDGTAKPQDDDIIRSKTIAKVISTNVSCTYEDGSYCVPCVLMAC